MTNTTEALKMAIGWLDNDTPESVLNACKEALESQEQYEKDYAKAMENVEVEIQEQTYQQGFEDGYDNAVKLGKYLNKSQEQEYDINEMINKITPENLQEPVAWMHRHEGEVLEFNDFKSCDKCEPLYTHPAQPLSEHAKNLGYLGNHCDDMKDAFMCGVQFAEVSHGIGVKDDN